MKIPIIVTAMLALLALCLSFGGCANQGLAIYQSTIAGRAAVQATTPLVPLGNPKVIAAAIAVSEAGGIADKALVTWNTDRLAGSSALQTDADAAVAALGQLETELLGLQNSSTNPQIRKASVASLAAVEKVKTAVKATSPATATQIAQIIAIALQELPVLTNWVNSAFSTTAVTDAQIQTELDGFAADLGALAAALQGH